MDIEKLLNFSIGTITLGKLFNAIVVFVVCYIGTRVLLGMIKRLNQRLHLDRALQSFIMAASRVVLYILTGLIVADSLGIPVTSLLAVFSVAGLAVSLAIQGTLSNLASGVMLLVSKPFAADHYIEMAGVGGTVREIGLIYTKIATPDNKIIYVPNSEISASKIINYSAEENRRIDVVYSASYDAPLETVKQALQEALKAVPQLLQDPVPIVAVTKYGDSAIEYTVRVWVHNPDYWPAFYALNEMVKARFDAYGVEMTYPHLNVHMIQK